MKIKKEQIKDNICKFIIYISILFVILFVAKQILRERKNTTINEITTSIISDNNENYTIYVEYPRFQSDNINSIITNVIYSYIKEFKNNEEETKILDMTYKIYFINDT